MPPASTARQCSPPTGNWLNEAKAPQSLGIRWCVVQAQPESIKRDCVTCIHPRMQDDLGSHQPNIVDMEENMNEGVITIANFPLRIGELSCNVNVNIPMETIRYWLAGQALAGTCANPEFFRMLVNLRKEILSSGRTALECDQIDQQILSKVCITAADALIATLKGGAE